MCGLWTEGGVKMVKRVLYFKNAAAVVSLLCLSVFSASCTADKMQDYYSQKNNYITAMGTVTHISYNDDKSVLYLGFSDPEPMFDEIQLSTAFGFCFNYYTVCCKKYPVNLCFLI